MVMKGLQAVDRYPKAEQAGIGCGLDHVTRQLVAAGLHRTVDAVVADRAHEGQPVPADERFPADDRNLAGAEFRQLAHDVDAFAGTQFLRTAMPGA